MKKIENVCGKHIRSYVEYLQAHGKSAFLIQDMFPVTEKYVEREYTIAGNHLMLTSEHIAKDIDRKAKKVVAMLKKGVKFTPTQPDVIRILEKLMNQ